jgi:hypothetical protein
MTIGSNLQMNLHIVIMIPSASWSHYACYKRFRNVFIEQAIISEKLPVACPWSVILSGYSGSFSTKTVRHDIAEILLKVALNTKKQSNQSIS